MKATKILHFYNLFTWPWESRVSIFCRNLTNSAILQYSLCLVRLTTVTWKTFTEHGHMVTLSDREIMAEAGLCVVIPCYWIATRGFIPQSVAWSKCQRSKSRCQDSDIIFNSADHSLYAGFRGRLSLLDRSPYNCSFIINDFTESDLGSSGSALSRLLRLQYVEPL